jgi:hypothetical protein
MERWTFDLNRIRKNWERASAPAEVTPEKLCPSCGAGLPRGRSSPEKIAPTATASPISRGLAPPRTMASRIARMEAPRDPYPDAQALLVRVRGLVHRQLADHEPILLTFLNEATEIVERLAAPPGEGESPPADKKALRADLERALADLEDMIALWSGIGR